MWWNNEWDSILMFSLVSNKFLAMRNISLYSVHTCKYKNLSCDILWKESSGTFRMWLSLRSKVIIALKLWNANSGSLVKYRALDIFKCCKALPTSLKASLWITDIRLLLKSILEMLGTCANAFLSMLTILALTWKQIKYRLLIKDLYRTHDMFSPILRNANSNFTNIRAC